MRNRNITNLSQSVSGDPVSGENNNRTEEDDNNALGSMMEDINVTINVSMEK